MIILTWAGGVTNGLWSKIISSNVCIDRKTIGIEDILLAEKSILRRFNFEISGKQILKIIMMMMMIITNECQK